MSLILDALNKAETERQKIDTRPGLDSQHNSIPPAPSGLSTRHKMAIAISLVLLITLSLIVYFFVRSPSENSHATNSQPIKSQTINSPPAEQGKAPTKKQPPLQPASNSKQQHVVKAERKSPAIKTNPAAAEPKTKTVAKANGEVSALYEEQKQVVTTVASAPKVSATATVTTTQKPPAPKPTPKPAPATTKHPTLADFDSVGSIRTLPWTLQEQIPTLNYEQHVYMPDNQGYVVINGTKRKRGQKIEKELVLDGVLQDGIILRYQNQLFKMPALNSWINM
jgi:hypothetical protein